MTAELNHKAEGDTHTFDFQDIQIVFDTRDGTDIGSEGGLRFRMFHRKEEEEGRVEYRQVDEFVIYPDAIDWDEGGRMKPEFEKRIKELSQPIVNEAEAEAPELLLEESDAE